MNNYDIIASLGSAASIQKGQIEQLERDIKRQKGTIDFLEDDRELVRRNVEGMKDFLKEYDCTFLSYNASIYEVMQAVQKKLKTQGDKIIGQEPADASPKGEQE